ncbi:unnamed protein product [Cylicocyclus nassatus]|uniref:Uncharacterized protein n=1 Tax=Cylicocyclus nassatus TaxID=53992 RepID=A0AA36DKV4_CYLNA|nr:unnamed protein product [Cylicocyclus nassatus]
MFEKRPRPAGRLNSKDFNIFIIREETELLRGKQGALECLDIVPFLNPDVETADDNLPYETEDVDIHTKLDDIEKLLQRLIEDTNTSKRSSDIESILRKLHRIESMLLEEKAKRIEETAMQHLHQITALIDEKSRQLEEKITDSNELIVNSMINLMTQISAILRTDQPSEYQRSSTPSETSHKPRKDRSRPPAKRPPRDPDYALLQRRLNHLAYCEKRQSGQEAAEPSQHHRCIFCYGPHTEDACTEHRSVEERRTLARDRNLCLFCLGKTCPRPCPNRTPCKLDNFAQAARRRERQLEAVKTPQASNESSGWTTRDRPPSCNQCCPGYNSKFSGRRQEWGSFWAIFQVTVDEQPIPTMINFNYPLQSLVGEAKQTAAQFQVVEANYQLVIEALKKKYGEDASIIEDLLMQLEVTKAEGMPLKLQANLLERITAILTQLAAKGQDVNQRLGLI